MSLPTWLSEFAELFSFPFGLFKLGLFGFELFSRAPSLSSFRSELFRSTNFFRTSASFPELSGRAIPRETGPNGAHLRAWNKLGLAFLNLVVKKWKSKRTPLIVYFSLLNTENATDNYNQPLVENSCQLLLLFYKYLIEPNEPELPCRDSRARGWRGWRASSGHQEPDARPPDGQIKPIFYFIRFNILCS